MQALAYTAPTMSNQTMKIKSRFATIKSAVEYAKLDLSYNPQAAAEKIAMLDKSHGKNGIVTEVFVTEDGAVYYILNCDIRLLNRFEPFHSILDDSAFKLVTIDADNITIHSELKFGRDKESRRVIGKSAIIVTNH